MCIRVFFCFTTKRMQWKGTVSAWNGFQNTHIKLYVANIQNDDKLINPFSPDPKLIHHLWLEWFVMRLDDSTVLQSNRCVCWNGYDFSTMKKKRRRLNWLKIEIKHKQQIHKLKWKEQRKHKTKRNETVSFKQTHFWFSRYITYTCKYLFIHWSMFNVS